MECGWPLTECACKKTKKEKTDLPTCFSAQTPSKLCDNAVFPREQLRDYFGQLIPVCPVAELLWLLGLCVAGGEAASDVDRLQLATDFRLHTIGKVKGSLEKTETWRRNYHIMSSNTTLSSKPTFAAWTSFSMGMPWLPTCMWIPVSQEYVRNNSITLPAWFWRWKQPFYYAVYRIWINPKTNRFTSSSVMGTPNFEYLVAVEVCAFSPAPTTGFTRKPNFEDEDDPPSSLPLNISSTIWSSWSLSRFTITPEEIVNSKSVLKNGGKHHDEQTCHWCFLSKGSDLTLVLQRPPYTTFLGWKPMLSACATSGMEAHSTPRPLSRTDLRTPRRGLTFIAKAFRINWSPKASARSSIRASKWSRSKMSMEGESSRILPSSSTDFKTWGKLWCCILAWGV